MRQHLDPWSRVIILVTFILFVAALLIKGLGHDLLLEGGVFLVSVKLILMAYKNSVAAAKLEERFDGLNTTLTRMERLLEARTASTQTSALADTKLPPVNNVP